MLSKSDLLIELHKLVWKDDDLMDQETLFTLQRFIDCEIINESLAGNLKIEQLPNGYIKKIWKSENPDK